jgi:catechol 2,3-dioxygenase-like lactoylglutathione lyase family enzyme
MSDAADAPVYRTGRLLDHVHLRVSDLEASKRFYAAALDVLGLGPLNEGPGYFQFDELFVSTDGPPTLHLHLAFQAADRATVDRWHDAVLAAGGRDNGGPGERHYHPGYYGAFALDPDGNNIEAVNHGPATRSAEAVEIRPA